MFFIFLYLFYYYMYVYVIYFVGCSMKLVKIYVGCVYDVCVLRNLILYKEVEVGKFVFVDKYEFVFNVYFFRIWFII